MVKVVSPSQVMSQLGQRVCDGALFRQLELLRFNVAEGLI